MCFSKEGDSRTEVLVQENCVFHLWSVREKKRDRIPGLAVLTAGVAFQISTGSQRLAALAAARPQMWQTYFAPLERVAT